jgi:pseudouridylate synthase
VLDKHLTAAPAGSEVSAVATLYRDRHQGAAAVGDEFGDHPALGAKRQAVGGVLDVAADEDPAVRREAGRPDRQSRIRRVSALGGALRRGTQAVPVDFDGDLPSQDRARQYTRPAMHGRGEIPIRLGEEVRAALEDRRPLVALETTLIVHGLPSPDNLSAAAELEDTVRDHGATPATVGVIAGAPVVGLQMGEIERLAAGGQSVAKLSSRDLGPAAASGVDGATTVAGTIRIAALAGISVMATGGLGGVHRGAATSFDESADLVSLHESPMLVVASGVKSVLDVGATLERLETLAVPVVGYRTRRFPGFYLAATEHEIHWAVESPDEAAAVFLCHRQLGRGGMLVGNPVPVEDQLDPRSHDQLLTEALGQADEKGIRGKDVTPFLLSYFATATDGESVRVNRALVRHNAALAAEIAAALASPSLR